MTLERQRAAVLAFRGLAGATAAVPVAVALSSPMLGPGAKAAAVAVILATIASPATGLALTAGLAPAGLLLAAPPARAAELLVWSCLAAWLLAVRRPLGSVPRGIHALLPALLFAACAAASWLAYVVGGAAGTEPLLLVALVARSLPIDHLVFSSPEPETFTLLPLLAGLALFAAAALVSGADRRTRPAIALAVAVSASGLALATIADVWRQWAVYDYEAWFLLRYLRGERFTLHLNDLNAAGSHYVLALLVLAAAAAADRRRRMLWIALALPIIPALWLSGSRSAALGGLIAGASVIPLARRAGPARQMRLRPAVLAMAALLAVALVAGGTALASGEPEQGTAANALRLRAHFLLTSARMFASNPLFGVAIGHYHEQSNGFMTPLLQRIYGYENAHNYFMQQFAELGAVGGVLFLWLAAGGLPWAWREVRRARGADPWALGLFAGAAGYLLTCLTGHPLLVPEAAIPFWAAFGAIAGSASCAGPAQPAAASGTTLPRWAAAVTIALALANIGAAARRSAVAAQPPVERGFYDLRQADDGTKYVWMTRHGVFYIGRQAGTVTIPLRATDDPRGTGRFRITVEVAGRTAGVYDVSPERWTTVSISLRRASPLPFRRVDLRSDRSWLPLWDGLPIDQPRSVMVGETRWTPAGGR